jgi:sulfatase maturation enzyme AslB (radical SAM superfamily)
MHPRTRLTLDLIQSFPRAESKALRAAAILAYGLSHIWRWPALERWQARHPLHAYLLLTTRCSMSCEDCYFVDVINKKTVGRLDFDMEQIESNFGHSLFRSVSRVVLIGGEPTMNKHFLDIIRFFRRKGVVVSVTTNGLRINQPLLEQMRDADLNMLNMSIYRKTERGVKYNLDRVEEGLRAANLGAFDPGRIVLSFHGIDTESYQWAYEFAVNVGARGLLFNRQFYTESNPSDGEYAEEAGFGEDFERLCRRIQSERKLNLYFTSKAGVPDTCPFTTNAFSIGPNDTLSPCCMVTPNQAYGKIQDPDALLAFKDEFISGKVPSLCKDCHMLGTTHF